MNIGWVPRYPKLGGGLLIGVALAVWWLAPPSEGSEYLVGHGAPPLEVVAWWEPFRPGFGGAALPLMLLGAFWVWRGSRPAPGDEDAQRPRTPATVALGLMTLAAWGLLGVLLLDLRALYVVFRKYPRVALGSLAPGEKLWCAAWLVAAVWLLVVPRLRRAISRPRDATARRPEP